MLLLGCQGFIHGAQLSLQVLHLLLMLALVLIALLFGGLSEMLQRLPGMCNYHRPGEEKRMVVLLDESQYDAWLDAPAEGSMDFMQACPPERLAATGEPVERAPAKAVPQTASLFD